MVWVYHSLFKEGLKKLTEIFPEWVANPGLSFLEPFQIILNKLVMQCVTKVKSTMYILALRHLYHTVLYAYNIHA